MRDTEYYDPYDGLEDSPERVDGLKRAESALEALEDAQTEIFTAVENGYGRAFKTAQKHIRMAQIALEEYVG